MDFIRRAEWTVLLLSGILLETTRSVFPQQVACLSLANGRIWGVFAGDHQAQVTVSHLADVMKMGSCDSPACQIIVSSGEENVKWNDLSALDSGIVTCQVSPAHNFVEFAIQFMRIVSPIILDAEQHGGVLLHGALVERDGYGVILAGPGGIGKTTTSRRFPAPWCSLCDDTTLVVRDEKGMYRAHPWPTWSTFLFGGSGNSWDVQRSVPLRSVLFLAHAQRNQIVSMEFDQAVGSLIVSTEQVMSIMLRRLEEDEARAIRLRNFDNVWALARAVSCYCLHLSRTGEFWHEIERVVDTAKGE